MKKVLSLVLTLALVCALAVTVLAANVGVDVDADIIGAGETVTVVVTLDETISADAGSTAVQGVLNYDSAALTYVSGTPGAGYEYLNVVNNVNRSRVQFSWVSTSSPQVPAELPAGTVVVVVFQANEATTAADLALSVSLKTADSTGTYLEDTAASTTITVCPDHHYEVTDGTPGTCMEPGTATYACASCGDTYTETTGGDHTLVHVEAVEPGCHYTGNIEHWYCTVCETVWQDEALTQVTNHMNVIVPALGGDVVHVEAVEPTCSSEGNIEYWYCEECEQVWQDEALTQLTNRMNVILPMAEHNLVHVEAVEAACHYTGNIEHWYCTVCETVWQDEALTQITNHMNVIIPALGGEVVHVEAVEPACHYTGNIEHWYCVECEQVWQDEALTQLTNHMNVILPALGGEVVHVEAVPATCYAEGNIEHWYCEECEQVWQDEALTQLTNRLNVILPMTEHNIVHMEAVEPGCHFTGNIEHWYCTICETVWQDEALTQITNHMNVIIPALGGEVVHVEAVEPTCSSEGNIEHWYCEECEQVWQDEALTQLTNHMNVIVPATHTGLVHVEAVEPGCHYTGNIEHWYCTDCETVWQDEALTQVTNHMNVILPALGGDVRHVAAAEATCTTDGHIEYWYCKDCNQVWQDEALTQLTNWKNIITEAALGHVDEEGDDGLCDVCGGNAKTGDFSIIVAAAAAVISMTGAVALPIAKKKFF